MMLVYNLVTGLLLAVLLLTPFVIKWKLDKWLALPAVLILGILAGLLVPQVAAFRVMPWWVTVFLKAIFIVAVAAVLLLWRFFRDPERSCGTVERAVIAAADGRVIYVKRFDGGQIPVSEKHGKSFSLDEFSETTILPPAGYLVGIAMSYLDVHVNRAPISGQVRVLKHIDGRFFPLKRPEAVFQNERAATVIEGDGITVGVIQIASRLVRNIISFVKAGDVVQQGQRFGEIRFGSQVDIILPDVPSLTIQVKPGDKIKAGISVLARY